jgi:hypothetical protein
VVAFAMALAGVVAVSGSVTALDVGAWQYNPTTGHNYRLVDSLTWVQAESYAVSVGGHLVTINDQAEQDWLMATFNEPTWPTQSTFWIGMNDRAVEGTWVWSSGEPVTYTNWVFEEPNNCTWCGPAESPTIEEGEDSAVMNWTAPSPPSGPPLGWNDVWEYGQSRALVEVTTLPKGPAGGTVTGTYHYFNFDDPTNPARARQVSVSAKGTDPVSGRWSLTWPAAKATISGDVTCLVVDGNQAWVAGRITKIKNVDPGEVGEGVFLWVRDGAVTGVPDRAYSWIGDQGQPLAEMEAWCLSKNVSMPGFAGGFTVDRGDVTVQPGR